MTLTQDTSLHYNSFAIVLHEIARHKPKENKDLWMELF